MSTLTVYSTKLIEFSDFVKKKIHVFEHSDRRIIQKGTVGLTGSMQLNDLE